MITINEAFTGAYVSEALALANAAHHCPTTDRYVIKTNTADQIIEIDPATWATSLRATTGGGTIQATVTGVWQHFVWVPALNGYAYFPRSGSKLWFLATN